MAASNLVPIRKRCSLFIHSSSSSRQGFSCWCGWTRGGFWPSSTFSKDAWGLLILKSIRKEVEEGNGNAKRNSRQTGEHRREDGCGVNSLEKPYLIWPWPWWRRPWTRRRHFSLRGGRGRARRSPTWPISSILHHCSCLLKPANEDKINCFDVSKLEFSKRPLKAVVFSFWYINLRLCYSCHCLLLMKVKFLF